MNRSRVTGDLTASGLLYADIANDRVGIGSTIPGNKLSLPDSAKIGLGNAEDLTLYHDGTNSWIKNTTGNLTLNSNIIHLKSANNSKSYLRTYTNDRVEIYFNNGEKFRTTSTGVSISGNNVVSGNVTAVDGTFSGDINVPTAKSVTAGSIVLTNTSAAFTTVDGAVGYFGTGSDLRVFHDGSNSYLQNITGNLIFKNASVDYITCVNSTASVELKYNNSTKFATTSSGVTVSGQVRIGDNSTTASTAGDDLVIEGSSDRGLSIIAGSGSSSNIYFGHPSDADEGRIAYQHNDNALDFSVNAGSTALRIDSAGRVLVSDSNAVTGGFGTHNWQPKTQILETQGAAIVRIQNSDAWGGALHLASANGTYSSPSAAASGDIAGGVYFHAYDGSNFQNYVAGIEAVVADTVASNDTPGYLKFSTTADATNVLSERLRIDSSGRILVGHTASIDQNSRIQSWTSGTDTFAGFKYGNNAAPNIIRIGKSRSASSGGNTIVANGDEIGRIGFVGADGSDFQDCAAVQCFVDGAPSNGTDMPGRLVFSTTSDASGSLTERLRIHSDGQVQAGTSSPTYLKYTGTATPHNNNCGTLLGNANIGLINQWSTINMPMDHSAATAAGHWWMLGRSAGTTGEWGLNVRTANANTNFPVLKVVAGTDGYVDTIGFYTHANERLHITSAGLVGINQTPTTAQLVVKNTNDSTLNTIEAWNDNGNVSSSLSQTSAGDGVIGIHQNGGTITTLLRSNGVSYINGGNLGIGINNPNRLLTLYGDSGIALQNSTTGTGNASGTHIWVNSSGNGELLIQNREASDIEFYTSDTERLRIDASGHIGQGVTPSGWATNGDFKAFQLGTGIAVFGRGSGDLDRGGISANYYHTGSAEKYIGNGHAGRMYFEDGSIVFSNTGSTANSAGANAALTLIERLRIEADGDFRLSSDNAATNYGWIRGWQSATGDMIIGADQSATGTGTSKSNLIFRSRGSEKVRIDSSGDLRIGNTTQTFLDGARNLVVGTGGGSEGITIYSSSSDAGIIAFADGTSDPSYRMGQILYDHGSNQMLFRINGNTNRLVIKNNGNTDIYASQVHLYNNVNTSNTYFYAQNTGAGNAGIKLKNNQGEWTIIANDRLRFIDDDAGEERLSITSAGKLGIGVISPDSLLHIHNGSAGSITGSSSANLTIESSGSYNVLQFLSPSTAAQQIRFGDTSDNGAGYIQYSHNDNALTIGVNGPEKFRIDSAGQIGFAGLDPSDYYGTYNNFVWGATSGSVGMTIVSGSSDAGYLTWADGTSSADQYRGRLFYSHSDNSFNFRCNGLSNNILRLDSSSVHITGTTDGVLNLDTSSGNGSFIRFKKSGTTKHWIGSATGLGGYGGNNDLTLLATSSIILATNSAERLRITSDGDVGIGVDPTSDFHLKRTSGAVIHTIETTATGGEALYKCLGKSSGGSTRTLMLRTDSGADAHRIITPDNVPIQIMTQNSTRLEVTGTGYVNRPNQPAFKATGNLTFTDWNTYEYCTWSTENYDNASAWNGYSFTCPTGAAGDYLFQVEFLGPGSNSGNQKYILFALFIGTQGQNYWRQCWSDNTNRIAPFSGMVLQLAVGDVVRVAFHKSYGRPYASGYTSISGCKIN